MIKARDIYLSDSLWELLKTEGLKEGASPCMRLLAQFIEQLLYAQRFNDPHIFNSKSKTRPLIRKHQFLVAKEQAIGDYFTFREKEGMISYMPKGREQQFNGDGTWRREGRESIKPAKWLRSMIHPRIAKRMKDHLFAKFDACLKAAENSSRVKFAEVSFEDAYNNDNYPNDIDSCMWGEPVGEFYRACGCRAIVAIDKSDNYRGRAVLWPDVKSDLGPITFMDRVYCDKPEILEMFLQHAKDQGWHHKSKQSRDSKSCVISPDGQYHNISMSVRAKEDLDDVSYYPYLDTFGAGDGDKLYNYECGYQYSYTQTDGSRGEEDPHEGEVQTEDGYWIPEEYACTIHGDIYDSRSDDVVTCHRTDEYVLRTECYRIELSRHETVYIHEDYVNYEG
jgi:hypothetical protein